MKKVLLFTIALLGALRVHAQNVGIGTSTPDATAMLDITATNRGILIPRVALTATNVAAPVTGPATSLLVYNTATAGTSPTNVWPGYYYWDGTQWVRVGSDGGDWSIRGNTLTGGTAATPNEVLGSNNAYQLHIRTNGTLRFRVADDQPQLMAEGNGTVGRPSYSWNGDNTSGMYRSGVGSVSFATQGTERLRLTNTPQILSVGNGTVAAPAWSWTGETNTGMYLFGTGTISFTTQGTERLRLTNTPQILSVGNGTAAAPSWSWTTTTTTGLFSPAANNMAFSTNATERMRINNLGQVVVNNTTPFAGDVFSSYAAGANFAISAYASGSGYGVYSQNTSTGFSIASVHTSTGGNLIASNTATATGRAGEFQTLNTAGTAATLFATNSTTSTNTNAAAVWGQSSGVRGVVGLANLANNASIGVNGQYIGGGLIDAIGVLGLANSSAGWGYGVFGQGNWRALYGNGNFAVSGTKAFQIDHPFDPENKFLLHYCLESPEVLNLYRGVVELNSNGEAVIEMPNYFHSININFSYQLTPVGASMPNLHVSKEIDNNGKFVVAGGVPNKKVSWVVYAERNDEWVKQNPLSKVVELDKKPHEKGKYLRPELYNQPKEKAIFDVEAKPQSATKVEMQKSKNSVQ